MSFVIYDIETTGTRSGFDQILQLAAIWTDKELNEVDRFDARSRLLPHIIPAPGALLVTESSIEAITNPALQSHYDMVRSARIQFMKWSPATFVGYNSLNFDEQFLRQALYQTLHPPYLTNTNGNKRGDVLRLVQATSVLAPQVITVPTIDKKRSFRLDQIAPANGIDHGKAHDALGDVEATLDLCRLIKSKAPKIWDQFQTVSNKAKVQQFVENTPAFFVLEFYFNRPFAFVVAPIGFLDEDQSSFLALDLSVDLATWQSLGADDLVEQLSKARAFRRIKLNACPFVMPLHQVPPHLAIHLPTQSQIESALALIEADSEFLTRLVHVERAMRKEFPEPAHVEERIYRGFPSRSDEARMIAFHASPWEKRTSILAKVQDARLQELGRRLIFLERPDCLPAEEAEKIRSVLRNRILSTQLSVPWLTIGQASAEAKAAIFELDGLENEILKGLLKYLDEHPLIEEF